VSGYDGAIVDGKIYVAWFPEQIKAVANSGDFDASKRSLVALRDWNIKWILPTFASEWDEAQRYPTSFPTQKAWLDACYTGKAVTLTEDQLGKLSNHTPPDYWDDLESEKKDRVTEQFLDGEVEMPIVVQDRHGMELVSGNTRLANARRLGLPVKVWLIQMESLVAAIPQLDLYKAALKEEFPTVDFYISEGFSNSWNLSHLVVPKAERKKGVGSRFMERLCEMADKAGVMISLTPAMKDDGFGTTSRTRLIQFYKRFGFRENKGRNKDFRFRDSMLRRPQTAASWHDDATDQQRKFVASLTGPVSVMSGPAPGVPFGLDIVAPSESVHQSAEATFNDFEIPPGCFLVSLDQLGLLDDDDGTDPYDSVQERDRIFRLAGEIKESQEIAPLFVAVEPDGIPWLLEGQHRSRALRVLGFSHVPAKLILSMDETTAPDKEEAADPDDEFKHDPVHREQLLKTGFWGKRGAGCLVLAQRTGRFLIGLRSSAVLEPGTWGTWGGAIDPDEKDPEAAVRRELVEETGCDQTARLEPLLVFRKRGFTYHNFLAIVQDEFEPQLNWENDGSQWCEFGDWPKPLHPGMVALLKDHASVELMKRMAGSTAAGSGPGRDAATAGGGTRTVARR
jgi:8-oxo-dGTP pyrophosphatase MutT (NUDIX family)/GNAT superfamily N-acetyltransferase